MDGIVCTVVVLTLKYKLIIHFVNLDCRDVEIPENVNYI